MSPHHPRPPSAINLQNTCLPLIFENDQKIVDNMLRKGPASLFGKFKFLANYGSFLFSIFQGIFLCSVQDELNNSESFGSF